MPLYVNGYKHPDPIHIDTFTGVAYTEYPLGYVVTAEDTGELRVVGPASWITFYGSLTGIGALSGVGDPNGVETSGYRGQPYINTATHTVYVSTVAGTNNNWQVVT